MKKTLAALAVLLTPLVATAPAKADDDCYRGARYSGYYGYSSSYYPRTYRYTSYYAPYRSSSYYSPYYGRSYYGYGPRYYGYGPSFGIRIGSGYASPNRYRYNYRSDRWRGYRTHGGLTGSRRYKADFGYNRGR